MKYGLVIPVVLFFLGGLIGCAGDKGKNVETGMTGSGANSLADLATYDGLSAALKNSDDVVLYDVRTPEEYAEGHIPGAVNIPYDVIGSKIPVKEKDAAIVVYCRSGNRSGQARRTLEGLGYTNIADFGAIGKWSGELTTGNNP